MKPKQQQPPPPICPYVGLQPFTEEEREYFFGREKDCKIISSNLSVTPLTILYGASGVGKSSVLLAGVMPLLRSKPNTVVLTFRDWHDPLFLDTLKKNLLEAIRAVIKKPTLPPRTLPLDQLLEEIAKTFKGSIFIVLDQFEEYFLYHPASAHDLPFEAEFAKAINRKDVNVNFLISLREDGLANLDRFKVRIPHLLSNLLRLRHLDSQKAEEAVRKPLQIYNQKHRKQKGQVSIDDDLVTDLLTQIKSVENPMSRSTGVGQTALSEIEKPIETAFLQLVMIRLWDIEKKPTSFTIRQQTFEDLGGVKGIIGTHLDKGMSSLTEEEQSIAAQIFHFLVTPSGTKISHTGNDLAGYSKQPVSQVTPVLNKLSGPSVRLLRPVNTPSSKKKDTRYEIFHDLLAEAILDWRRQHQKRMDMAKAYALWLKNRPWGYLRNLFNGTTHVLEGELVSIGRSVDYWRNYVDLQNIFISRIHLFIFRSQAAFDIRSKNGTTVNAEYLTYMKPKKLEKGDFIVFSGVFPFQFFPFEYPTEESYSSGFTTPTLDDIPPLKGWGILIDGNQKRYHPLRSTAYSLLFNAEKESLIVTESKSQGPIEIEKTSEGQVTILNQSQNEDLRVLVKTPEADEPLEGTIGPLEQSKITPGMVFHFKGITFQISLLNENQGHDDLFPPYSLN